MQKIQTISLVILASIAVAFSLAFLKSVLLPFVIAVFIVIGCRPILEFIETKLKLHRIVAFVVAFLSGMSLLFGIALLIWISVADLSRNAEAYEERINLIANFVIKKIPEYVDSDSGKDTSGLSEDGSGSTVSGSTVSGSTVPQDQDGNGSGDLAISIGQDTTKSIQEMIRYFSANIEQQLASVASSLSELLSYGVLISIFVFFLLFGQSEPESKIADQTKSRPGIVSEVEAQIRKYLVVKTIISLLTGLVFGMVLWLFGVPLAIVFAVLAFLLNFIPNIGPLIAIILPVPFLLLNSNISPTAGIVCFVLISIIQFVSGNVIETRVMGKSFDVSPVFLLLALMFFGLIWGIVGMFLATPIVSIIKIVLTQTQMGKPLAELMAGRWSS